ncbi:mitochondrial import protein Pam17-domain-containing protein [Phycomyces nitens]|nr:mitochondrial import protein Pam17-domain-containing protein [Phycomyces nitens]
MSLRAIQTIRPHLKPSQPILGLAVSRLSGKQAFGYSTSSESERLIPTWDDYFKLRKKRRMFELAAYPPSTILPIITTGAYCMNLQVDPTETYLGLDPVTGLGLLTLSTGFFGLLLGPLFGDALFKLTNRKMIPEMEIRDKAFYEHIKNNRADARLNSIRNPVPDYYGEKIQSVADYRAWLRKQREHYRKGVFGGNVEDDN